MMMTTESPVRMVETGGATNWQPSKGVATFASQLHNNSNNDMGADELEMLLNTQRYHGEERYIAPNRSGSAPPNIEGSFAAYSSNLMAQQISKFNKSSMPGFGNSLENSEPEEQMRADPAYIAYYYSNVNLNPRLPPPLTKSGVNRGDKTGGGVGNTWRLTSYDDSGNGSGHFARNSLSPHNEEPEDDKSDNCSDADNIVTPGYDASSLDAHHKTLVDLIQEDFPRTPSPLYNLSHSSNQAATVDEGIAHDVQSISLENLLLNASKLSNSNLDSVNAHVEMKIEGENQYGSASKEGPLATSFLLRRSNPDTIADAPGPLQDVQPSNKNTGRLLTGATKSDALTFRQQTSNEKFSQPLLHVSFSQPEDASGQSKFPSPAEVSQQQHFLQPPGRTPPLYATAATFMTTSGNLPPFYPGGSHLSSASMYATAPPPQYGGYTPSSAFIPPFIAGYSTGGVHVQYDPATATLGFNGHPATSFSSGEAFPHTAGDLLQQQQHANKFYGGPQHRGLSLSQMQPSFPDPLQMQLQMQYFKQQSVGQDAYGAQHGWPASMTAFGGQDCYGSFSSEKQAPIASYRGGSSSSTDQMFLAANVRRGSSSYYGNAPLTQFRASPFGSPILPASPVAAVGSVTLQRRNELWLDQRGNSGIYDTRWQGQRGNDSSSDSQKKHSILDELKSCTARKIDLSDISGRINEFSIDQHGSRFIQQKLENCKDEERESVFREVLPHAPKLITDVFGNYVIQKFFEHGSREQRKQLADQLSGQILPLTLQMYGCRVIQKALEVIELDQKTELVNELDGHVLRCVRDQNGNHVIQKCIESIPTEKIGFIISSFQGHVATLSTHPYGCRVIQRVLEHCGDGLHNQCIVDEILESAHILALDQYGNYVTQHVLQRGKPHERSQIISKLSGRIVQMSQHKYASNVVEKCLDYGDVAERERLIEEILGQSEENNNLLAMMKDQFANYVVQKILEISNDKQREVLLHRINVNLQALRKYTYGKHIVARFEQLCGEEADESGS